MDINKLIVREQDLEPILYLQSYYKIYFSANDDKIIQTPFAKICEDEVLVQKLPIIEPNR